MWLPEKPNTEYNQLGWLGADWASLFQHSSRSDAFQSQFPAVQPSSPTLPANPPHLLASIDPWMRGLPKPSLFLSLFQSLDCGTGDYPDPDLVLDLSCKRAPSTGLDATEKCQASSSSCASQLPPGVPRPSRECSTASPAYRPQPSPSPSRSFSANNTTPLDPLNRLPNGTPEGGPHVKASATADETANPGVVWNALATPYYPLMSSADLFSFLPLTLDQNMTCPFCRKAFRFEKNLLRHLQKTHATGNGESILKCKLCSYTTRHYSNMYVHIRTHTGDKPYTCSGCGAAFTQGSSLKLHIKSRHNDNLALFSLSRKPGKNNLTKLWTRVLKKDLPKYEAAKFNSIFASYYRLNYYQMLAASTSSFQPQLMGDQPFPSLQSDSQPENEAPPPPPLLSQFLPFSFAPPDLTTPLPNRQSPPADESISPDVAMNVSDSYDLDTSAALRPPRDRSLLSSSSSSSPASSFMVRSLTDELPPSDGETSNGARYAPAADFTSGISTGALYDAIISNPVAFQSSKVKVENMLRRTP